MDDRLRRNYSVEVALILMVVEYKMVVEYMMPDMSGRRRAIS